AIRLRRHGWWIPLLAAACSGRGVPPRTCTARILPEPVESATSDGRGGAFLAGGQWVIALAADGGLRWQRRLPGTSLQAVAADPRSGDVLAGGRSHEGAILLRLAASDGAELWARRWIEGDASVRAIAADGASVAVAGYA